MDRGKSERSLIVLIILGLPLILCSLFMGHIDIKNYNGVHVAEIMLGIWTTMLGFIITAISIILSMGGNNFIVAFKKSRHYRTVLFLMIFSAVILFLAAVFAAVVVCFQWWKQWLGYLMAYFLFATAVAIALVLIFLFYLIKNSIGEF